jgi:hypothetical protein
MPGTVFGMATTKITITVDNDQLAEIHALVADRQASCVSGFIKRAAQTALPDVAGWRDLLKDALEQTGGPLTKKERRWADQLLSPNEPRRAKKRQRTGRLGAVVRVKRKAA